MSRLVQAVPGAKGLTLPGGWALDEGDTVVLPDAEWDLLLASEEETVIYLLDLGETTDPPDPVPTYRDLQRSALP